uniref:Uncharacterized protein n=1 Tax=Romanomermis culicivorax TaxID=13658 RepID=A0A915HPI0_ROMCU
MKYMGRMAEGHCLNNMAIQMWSLMNDFDKARIYLTVSDEPYQNCCSNNLANVAEHFPIDGSENQKVGIDDSDTMASQRRVILFPFTDIKNRLIRDACKRSK